MDLTQCSPKITYDILDAMLRMHKHFWNQRLDISYPWLDRPCDYPYMSQFVKKQFPAFRERWQGTLTLQQMNMVRYGVEHFADTQTRLSQGQLTLCHGDIKAGNIFFLGYQQLPIFCDWQYVGIGKGLFFAGIV